jgi:hypothetical protein
MSESLARIALLLFGILGCLAGFCFLWSYRHLRPGSDAVRRRAILQGSLSRQDLFTQEGWAWRLRGWIFCWIGSSGAPRLGPPARGSQPSMATTPRVGPGGSTEPAVDALTGDDPALGVEQLADHVGSGAGHDEARWDPGRSLGDVATIAVEVELHFVADRSPGG